MSSEVCDEPLSLELFQQECERRNPKTRKFSVTEAKPEDLLNVFYERAKAASEVFTSSGGGSHMSKEAVETYMNAAFDFLLTMLRVIQLAKECYAIDTANTGGGGGETSSTIGESTEVMSPEMEVTVFQCMEVCALWLVHLPCLPHFHVSCIVARVPAILASVGVLRDRPLWNDFFVSTAESTAEILRAASQRFPMEAGRCCLPRHSLLPPWKALVTCAQYNWTWEQLRALTLDTPGDNTTRHSSGIAAIPTNGLTSNGMSCDDVTFLDMQGRLELAHADRLAREVFLFSYDSLNWKVGNAVPTVKSIAPSMWYLFLRCRSFALHHTAGCVEGKDGFAYFQDGVARRLIARVLQRTIDGVRACLTRHATDMHPDRVEQLTVRDMPCLVLMTRLWYCYLQPCQTLLDALHASLVRMVNTAVELGNPLTVDESTITRGRQQEDQEYAVEMAERAQRFLDVVWNVKPLQEDEVALENTGVPWSSDFPRAAAVQAVLDAHVVVTSVE
jgi:hypothetical protein